MNYCNYSVHILRGVSFHRDGKYYPLQPRLPMAALSQSRPGAHSLPGVVVVLHAALGESRVQMSIVGVSHPHLVAGESAAVRRPYLQRHHQVRGELPDRHV